MAAETSVVSKQRKTRKCQNTGCKKEFKTKRDWHIYCSDSCRMIVYAELRNAVSENIKEMRERERLRELDMRDPKINPWRDKDDA